MFNRMLRPSRRQYHEQISQTEEHDGGGDLTSPTNQAAGGQGPSIVIINDNTVHQDDGTDNHEDDEELRAALALSMQQDDQQTETEGGETLTEINLGGDTNNQDHSETNNADSQQQTITQRANSLAYSSDSDDENNEQGTHANPTTHPANNSYPFLLPLSPTSPTSTSQQLISESELQYRRQSTCTLLILFFLIRLWIEALIEKNIGLIFLCSMGTIWTYKWFVSRREMLEQQILNDHNNTATARGVGVGEEGNGNDAAINYDPDLGLMSFQAQLALAILESQRQMIEGGGYNTNTNVHENGPGVTEEAKEKWKVYKWGEYDTAGGADGEENEITKLAVSTSRSSLEAMIVERAGSNGHGDYGSVEYDGEGEKSLDKLSPLSKLEGGLLYNEDEEPSCSICLCDYEKGENVSRLPCDHIYHEGCIKSWTESHFRCPLCNYDLMQGYDQPVNVQAQQQAVEEQRAFRTMALSTLGRRIRSRRRTSNRARATVRAAALAAATEDSIV